MDTYNTTISSKERTAIKSIGRGFASIGKIMGILLLISLILTGITAVTANPNYSHVNLNSGETKYVSTFFVDKQKNYQIVFGVDTINGNDYTYNIDDGYGLIQHMSGMEWLINVVVEKSDSLSFTDTVVVADISGDINTLQLDLQTGFYRIKVTNLTTDTLGLVVGSSSVNIGLLISTIIAWIVFAMVLAIFVAAVHIVLTVLFFYVIIKLIMVLAEDNKTKPTIEQSIITPQKE